MGLFKLLKNKENAFYLNKLQKKAKKVMELESHISTLSDKELQYETEIFKKRLQLGETLDDLLIEAFAVVREAAYRVLKMKHYEVQIIGGIALHEGNITEMKTGEGKTLVGTLPAYLNALTGKGVHIVTVNEYLATRDHEIMSPLYRFLGLTTSVVTSSMSKEEKREAYQADIVYVTNTEVGFDYLRDNMVLHKKDKVQRELNFCIVDEVDSVLLDDARTPLIISGQGEEPSKWYQLADIFVRLLQKEEDFIIDEEYCVAVLTDKGLDKVEKFFRIENYTDPQNRELRFYLEKALHAHYVMQRDKDYILHQNEIKIIDASTGRISEGRRFSHGLHQALEAKEGVRIQRENQTLATITYQNFFLLYNKLSGMTGTAVTNEEEFQEIYRLKVVVIPTNKPVIRKDHPDQLFLTAQAKNRAIIQDVRSCYESGQPVLIGTSSIEKSEELSQLLTQEGIPHVVLNAKNHKKEASIIAQAGQKHSVTIATNMAGRGTDIKLGEGVRELGGLKVIGTERASNRRIDNQLIGRSGRQGDPGESQFYLSFEDDLLRIFTSEQVRKRVELLATDDNEPIQMKMLLNSIHAAQARLEGIHFDARKQTIEYDTINNEQRVVVYKQRNQLLEEDFDVCGALEQMAMESLRHQLDTFDLNLQSMDKELPDYQKVIQGLQKLCERIGMGVITIEDELTQNQKTIIEEQIERDVRRRVQLIREQNLEETFRMYFIQTVDTVWRNHLQTLEGIKEQVKFAGYKQTNPIDEYARESFEAFGVAMQSIQDQMIHRLYHVDKTPVAVEG